MKEYEVIDCIDGDNITQSYHVKEIKTNKEYREEIYPHHMKEQVINAIKQRQNKNLDPRYITPVTFVDEHLLYVFKPYYNKSIRSLVDFSGNMTNEIPICYWIDMLLALNQLEANGIIHGHITLESFFIEDNHLILNDVTPLYDIMINQHNNVCYKSMDELSGISTPSSDLRRVGIILYILLFNRNPYPNEKSVFDEANGKCNLNFDGLDNEYKEILQMLLNPINITTSTVLDKLFEIKNRNENNNDENRIIASKNLRLPPPSSSTDSNNILLSSSVYNPPNPLLVRKSGKRIGNYILSDDPIGNGASSQVYIGELAEESDGRQYAIKLIDIKEETEDLFMSEARSLISLNEKISNHVIKFIDAFCEDKKYVLVTEFCQLGDLKKELDKRKENNQHYTSDEIVRHFHNLLFSLSELHKHNIIHRDIKPENIFFAIRENHRRLLFGDFGLCTLRKEEDNEENGIFGTPKYIAPEIMRGDNYNYLIDCWSLGCVLYEMCTLQFLYKQNYPYAERNTTKIDVSYPNCITQIVDGMTEIDREKRMSATDALNLLKQSTPIFN